MDQLTIVKDIKKEVEFWLNALANENLNKDNKELLNRCLYFELNNHLYPVSINKLDD